MSGAELAALLDRHGFDFFTGVPCSLVESLIAAIERHPRAPWLPAVREDVAVGMAAGAWLGGRRPVVVMQNSGLGTSLNALASLSLMYGFPALLVVTWRGHAGKDAPEHILMGEITPRLLDLLGIPYRVLGQAPVGELVQWARTEMDAREIPVALVVPPGVVETGGSAGAHTSPLAAPAPPPLSTTPADAREELVPVISRREALGVALKELDDEPVVHANGYMCRESFAIGDRPQNFYMIGSMGLASAIGLGLALVGPERRSVVFDGDGNLLMSLGTWQWWEASAPGTWFTSSSTTGSTARPAASPRRRAERGSTASRPAPGTGRRGRSRHPPRLRWPSDQRASRRVRTSSW